ncbi:sensor histidine kinase [Streptomyces sp. NPDC004609]|uniref:sensor histidine kinase n=1 Tax=Streptomyces sp. NPDC004609 TaxID=3364704 RepID=UPI0036BCFF60
MSRARDVVRGRRASVRVRLTALYSGLFITAVTILLITVNLLLGRVLEREAGTLHESYEPYASQGRYPSDGPNGRPGTQKPSGPSVSRAAPKNPDAPELSEPGTSSGTSPGKTAPPPTRGEPSANVRSSSESSAERFKNTVLAYQWDVTWIAVGVLALVSVAAGWWLAGRLLRPLHLVTATAKRLSLSRLDERIALRGPRDELKELADTFDDMLERLQRAADTQRRFIANASHELRTPLAVQRAAIDIGLDRPTPQELAEMRQELLNANIRTEKLIDGLLMLAQGERGLESREPVRLDELAVEAAAQYRGAATGAGIALETDLAPAVVEGDAVLLTRLIGNLVHNAVRYNHPGGRVLVRTTRSGGITVTNTGPVVPAGRVPELYEPFRRLRVPRTAGPGDEGPGGLPAEGAGLGLSIVAAIADAHDAPLTTVANPDGGLTISVTLPAPSPLPAP